jgi:hydroxymethylpyrimidine/phosphomethylpyrimidine kinase
LTAALARGQTLPAAVRMAKAFVHGALAHARPVGRHAPLNFRWPL